MKRKKIIELLTAHFGFKPKYLGMPSGAYQYVTDQTTYKVDLAGVITTSEGQVVDLETLLSGVEGGSAVDSGELKVESVESGVEDPAVVSEAEIVETVEEEPKLEDVETPQIAEPVEVIEIESESEDAETQEITEPVEDLNGVADPVVIEQEPKQEDIPEVENQSNEPDSAPEQFSLEVSVPLDGHTSLTLVNLLNLIYSKQSLIQKSIGVSETIIKDSFIAQINGSDVNTPQDFRVVYQDNKEACPGISFDFDADVITFKFFTGLTNTENIQAYSQFIALLNQTALTQHYASPKVSDTDNDKFTFRVWLVKLGMVGKEYKTARKILLANLSGNSAFKSGSKPEKVETAI